MQNPFKAVMNHLLNTYYGTKIDPKPNTINRVAIKIDPKQESSNKKLLKYRDPKPKTINKVALSMNVDNLLTR